MSNSILSLSKSKFREKRPRSCRFCGTLDPRSEWVSADFHGVQTISSKKSLVIQHITAWTWTIRHNTQNYCRSHHVLPELMFKDKTSQGMEHVCLLGHQKELGCQKKCPERSFFIYGMSMNHPEDGVEDKPVVLTDNHPAPSKCHS